MPTPLIKKFAEKAKKPEWQVEEIWKRCKEQAKGIRRSDIIDKDYWRLVTGLMKKELGLSEDLKPSFKDFIAEILDSRVDYKIGADDNDEFEVSAEIGKRTIYFYAETPETGTWEIEFSEKVNDRRVHHLTNSGNEFEVFAFIKKCLQMLIDKKKPKEILFSSSKSEENRTSLYSKLIKKLPGYNVEIDHEDSDTQVKFKLVRK